MDFRLSLSTLDCFFYSIPTSNAPEQVKVLLQPIADFQQVIQRTDRQVTFFGVFNAGKSTLLNAIIGSRVLPTHVNRATGVITKLVMLPSRQLTLFVLRQVPMLRSQSGLTISLSTFC